MILFFVAGLLKTVPAEDHVILLHGLLRSSSAMVPLQSVLRDAGFKVHNIDYPSRSENIEILSIQVIEPAVQTCRLNGAVKIHFVTHSMGGILVRNYLSRHVIPELGRVVMLGPPNHGSEVVDVLGDFTLFGWLNGPAGQQLGTVSNSIPKMLGPPAFSTGIIAGNRSINWINSLMIPGRDDGKVSIESTKLSSMDDFIILPVSHPFIMKDEQSIYQTIRFLKTGKFDHSRDGQ